MRLIFVRQQCPIQGDGLLGLLSLPGLLSLVPELGVEGGEACGMGGVLLVLLAKVQIEPQPAAKIWPMIFRDAGGDQGRIEAGR